MKAALGKGLEALLPGKGREVLDIDIERVAASETQPRRNFRDDSLRELADSIREKGVLQPVIVTRQGDGTFRLIAGERRLRASRLAGLKKIPALLRESTPEDALEVALIENIQREDLNPIETAEAFQRLMDVHGLRQEDLSTRVGKERATVANYLRLLKLENEVKRLVAEGTLSMGHAKAIASLDDAKSQLGLARTIVHRGLSVRETETAVKRILSGKKKPRKAPAPSAEIASLEDRLIRSLGTKVKLKHKGKKGKIEIEYYSLEELDRLVDILLA